MGYKQKYYVFLWHFSLSLSQSLFCFFLFLLSRMQMLSFGPWGGGHKQYKKKMAQACTTNIRENLATLNHPPRAARERGMSCYPTSIIDNSGCPSFVAKHNLTCAHIWVCTCLKTCLQGCPSSCQQWLPQECRVCSGFYVIFIVLWVHGPLLTKALHQRKI